MNYGAINTLQCSLFVFLLFLGCKEQKSVLPSEKSDLYHHSIGDGAPVIVIHGGPGLGCAYLENHLAGLSNKHQVIFYDQRNSGRSALHNDSTQISLASFLKDINVIRKEYGHKKISLIGHSWGGLLAMKYALQFPEQTEKLILINSVAANSELNDKANTLLGNKFSTDDKQARAQIMRTEAFTNQKTEAYDELMMLGFAYQFSNRNLINQLELKLPEDFAAKSTLLAHLYKDLYQYNFTEDLKKIESPTLLLYGLDDPLTPFTLNSLAQAIPNNQIEAIEDAGHFPFIEKNETTLSKMITFLSE